MKRRLFNIAHAIKNNFNTFAEALVHAWRIVKFQFELCTKAVVNFKYKKVDGSIRNAVGTLETVPLTKGIKKPTNYGLVTYFDLEVKDWRSFKVENFIS